MRLDDVGAQLLDWGEIWWLRRDCGHEELWWHRRQTLEEGATHVRQSLARCEQCRLGDAPTWPGRE